MAYTRSKSQMMIRQAILKVGIVNNPQDIGGGVVGSPLDQFVGDDIGYIDNASLQDAMAFEYAELLGEDQALIRVDPVSIRHNITFRMLQFNISTMELAYGGPAQPGYTNGSWIGDLLHAGQALNICNSTAMAVAIIGERTDCKLFGILMYSGVRNVAAVNLLYDNTHLKMDMSIVGTPDERFPDSLAGRTKNVSVRWIEQSP